MEIHLLHFNVGKDDSFDRELFLFDTNPSVNNE